MLNTCDVFTYCISTWTSKINLKNPNEVLFRQLCKANRVSKADNWEIIRSVFHFKFNLIHYSSWNNDLRNFAFQEEQIKLREREIDLVKEQCIDLDKQVDNLRASIDEFEKMESRTMVQTRDELKEKINYLSNEVESLKLVINYIFYLQFFKPNLAEKFKPFKANSGEYMTRSIE